MSNMCYVRFENTAGDLEDCLEHVNDALSPSEEEGRQQLLELCHQFIDSYDEAEVERNEKARDEDGEDYNYVDSEVDVYGKLCQDDYE